MGLAVGDQHPVVGADPDRVRNLEEILVPNVEQAAVAIEDDDGGVGLAIDDVDPVLGVGRD